MRIDRFKLICPVIFLLVTFSSFRAVYAIDTSTSLGINPEHSRRVGNAECLTCHDDIKPDAYNASVHGKNLCTSCHADIAALPHREKLTKPVCNQCHRLEAGIYNSSDHGVALKAGIDEAASCRNCHGQPHFILNSRNKDSSVYRANIPKTCAFCHEDQKKMAKYTLTEKMPFKSYSETVHGKALIEKGLISSAICTDCHGSHDLYSMANPKSKIYRSNVPSTCGKCHPGAGAKLAKGSVHITPSATRDKAVFYVTVFYIFLIAMTIGGMSIYVLLDYLAKLREHYETMRAEAKIVRWTFSERFQHGMLLITFTVLAYTGFALRFSDAWWAFPFTVIKDGFDWRRILHRATAVVFCLLCAYHAWFLSFTKRGRSEFKAFLPKIKDFVDLHKTLKHNLRISKEKPKFERFNFVEKSEYWALIWGSLIMVITGALLTFNNLMMRFFPKWVLDVAATIHFYEAVLATLAIVIWHLYFSIFSPEHYPMNWSWITGHITEDERRENDTLKDKEQ